MFQPDIDNLFFIGLLQPLGAIMPLAEAQGGWVAAYLRGEYALPDPTALRRDIETERKKMFKRYVASKRHTMQVDFDNYLHDLGKELRAGAERARRQGFRLPVPARAPGARRGRRVSRGAAAPAEAGRRERTKVQNRGAILAAAREVFVELGYDAAGVRDIVRRTGLAAGTFYNYFPDKEAVFRALVDEFALELRARVREARARATGPEEFVREGYRAFFGYVAQEPVTFELIRRNAGVIPVITEDPVLGVGVTELARDLAAATERGELPPHDVDLMAAAMTGVALELAGRMLERRPLDPEGPAAFATELFLGGIARLARSSGSAPRLRPV